MKLIFILIGLIATTTFSAQAQELANTNDSVRAVVNKLFTAMKEADSAMIRSCFSDNAVMQTIAKNKAGKTIVAIEPVNDFVSFIGKEAKGNADERIEIKTILSDGGLATVWTPYQFYYKGKFSHCGVNSFQLVRLNNEWKIQYIIDTRRTTGCQ